jgi:hypothetical protein
MTEFMKLKEVLGQLLAAYSLVNDPAMIMRQTDFLITLEYSMLGAMRSQEEGGISRLHDKLDEKGTTYKDIFVQYRQQWATAIDRHNTTTGDWKDSWIICSKITDELMRIALTEDMIEIRPEAFNVSQLMQGMERPKEE